MVMMRSVEFERKEKAPAPAMALALRASNSFKKRDKGRESDDHDDNVAFVEDDESLRSMRSLKKKKPGKLQLQMTGLGHHQLVEEEEEAHNYYNSITTYCSPNQGLELFLSSKPAAQLHAAATKLQKFYKSYRTRRNLADCAVVVEELWWKALEFAALRRSSVSFFNSDKSETAVSRWARARTRAAKVGKGLSKDVKGQQLALRHWLEAIDPRHRYGHNLHFYYNVWFESGSSQPFFYWLDVGEGKEVNLEKCPRSTLQRQCIKYLGPKEREGDEVIVERGKLIYKQSKVAVNTGEGSKWMFVLSTSRVLYVGQKEKGLFHHSSFLAGGATLASGRLVVHQGTLDAAWSYSGHYRPTEENFVEFCSFLEEHHVDLTNVKKYPVDDDVVPINVKSSSLSVSDQTAKETTNNNNNNNNNNIVSCCRSSSSSSSPNDDDMISNLPNGEEASVKLKDENNEIGGNGQSHSQREREITVVDKAKAKAKAGAAAAAAAAGAGVKCSKWSTGVGPRIGCVRDYPTKLQLKAWEQVHYITSPRPRPRVSDSSRSGGPNSIPSPSPCQTLHSSPTVRPRLAYLGLVSPRVRLSATN